MFVVRSESGMVFTSCTDDETYGKEIMYEQRREAEIARKSYEDSFTLQKFNIEEIKVGRPQLGITKKVSLTLSEEDWKWFDEKARGNRSDLLRRLVWEKQSPEAEWDNYACLGYVILGARKIGMDEEQIKNLISSIHGEFDLKSVDQANEVYVKSDY